MKIQNITYIATPHRSNKKYFAYDSLDSNKSRDIVSLSFKGKSELELEEEARIRQMWEKQEKIVVEKLSQSNLSFCPNAKRFIADVVWERKTLPVLNRLLSPDKDGNLRFNRNQVISLIGALRLKDLPILEGVMSAKDDNGNNLYDGEMIDFVLSSQKYKVIRAEALPTKETLGKTLELLEEQRQEAMKRTNHQIAVSEKLTQANRDFSKAEKSYIEEVIWSKDAMPLLDRMLEQDEKCKQRFDKAQITALVTSLTMEDLPVLKRFMDAKNDRGENLFDGKTIKEILTSVKYKKVRAEELSPEETFNKTLKLLKKGKKGKSSDIAFGADKNFNVAFKGANDVGPEEYNKIFKQVSAKLKKTGYDFCINQRTLISEVVCKRNTMPILDKLLEREDDKLRFTRSQITALAVSLHLSDLSVLTEILSMKDENGKNLYDGEMIDLALTSFEYRHIRKQELSMEETVEKVIPLLEEERERVMERTRYIDMVANKLSETGYNFSSGDKEYIAVVLVKGKNLLPILEKITKRDENGELRFSKLQIESLLKYLDSEDFPVLEKLMDDKNKEGKYKYDGRLICNVLTSVEYMRIKQQKFSAEEKFDEALRILKSKKERTFFKRVFYRLLGK